jgi:hypothetical protein
VLWLLLGFTIAAGSAIWSSVLRKEPPGTISIVIGLWGAGQQNSMGGLCPN